MYSIGNTAVIIAQMRNLVLMQKEEYGQIKGGFLKGLTLHKLLLNCKILLAGYATYLHILFSTHYR